MDTTPSSADMPPDSSRIDPAVPPVPVSSGVAGGQDAGASPAPTPNPAPPASAVPAEAESAAVPPTVQAPPKKKKKRSCLGCFGRLFLLGILLLALLAALAPYLIPTDHLRRRIAATIAAQTGRPCTLAALEINLYAGGVVVRGLEIGARTPGAPKLCTIERGVLVLDWRSLPRLLRGEPARIETLRLEQGEIVLQRSADGTLSIEDLLDPPGDTETSGGTFLLPVVPESIVLQEMGLRFLDEVSGSDTRIGVESLTIRSEDLNEGIHLKGRVTLQDVRSQRRLGALTLDGRIDLFEGYALQEPEGMFTLGFEQVDLAGGLRVAHAEGENPVTAGTLDGTIRLHIAPERLRTEGELQIRDLATRLPDRELPVTFPTLGVAFAVRPVLQEEGVDVDSLVVTSPLGHVALKGGLRPAAQAEGVFPVDASGTVEANLSLKTLHAFVKEHKLALLPASMEGSLGLEGTFAMDSTDLRLALGLQGAPIHVEGSTLREPVAVGLRGKMTYAYREDALEVGLLRIEGEAAYMETAFQATGLWRDARSLSLRLDGEADLARLVAAVAWPPALEGFNLEGKSALEVVARTEETGAIRLQALLKTPDAHPVTFHTPDPVREAIPLGAVRGRIDASFQPAPDPAANRLMIHSAELASIPLAVRLTGQAQPMTGAWSVGYVCRFHPTRAQAILEKTVPYELGDWIRELSLQGQASHDPGSGMLRFANSSATGTIDLQGAPYDFALFHDGNVHPSKGHFKTDKLMLTLSQESRTVFSAAVSVNARGPWIAPLGEADFDLNGDLYPLYGIGARFLPLPAGIKPYAGMTMRGRLVHNEAGVQGEWNSSLQQVQILSDKGWRIREPGAEASLAFTYAKDTQTLHVSRLHLQTAARDLLLAGRGGLTLRENGDPQQNADWSFQPGSHLRLDLDSDFIPRVLDIGATDADLPHGILRASVTPEGTFDTPSLTLQAVIESMRIPGAPRLFPDSARIQAQILPDNRGALRPADAFLVQIPSLHLRLPGFASLAMQGRLQHLRAGEDGSLDLGPRTALSFRAQSNRVTPALLLGSELPAEMGKDDSVLVEGQMILPGAGAGEEPFWQRFLRATELRNGRVAVDEILADGRAYRDIRARLAMQDGILRLEDGHVLFGGPMHARFTADLNHPLPRCELRFRTEGVPIVESVAHIGGYTRFLGGTIIAPYPHDGTDMVFQWEGVTEEDFERTLRIPRTTLVVQDFRLYARQETTDWNLLMQTYVPQKFHEELMGDVERIREAEARMRETLDMEIHYKTFLADFEVRDQLLLIHDVRIEGGNTADFAVVGRIGFDESLRLDVMPIRHMDRTLHTDAILQNREIQNALRHIPAQQRAAIVRIVPDWVEEIAQARKIRMPVSGTTTNPVTHPDKLAEGIMKELQRDLPKLIEKAVGSFLREGGLEDALGEEGSRILRQLERGGGESIDLRRLF